MIEEADVVLPIWMLLAAAFGFIVGEAVGDSRRHRKCLEEANEDLHDALDEARGSDPPLRQLLEQQRDASNDIHTYLLPGPKGSTKPSSKNLHHKRPDLTDPAVPKRIDLETAIWSGLKHFTMNRSRYCSPKMPLPATNPEIVI